MVCSRSVIPGRKCPCSHPSASCPHTLWHRSITSSQYNTKHHRFFNSFSSMCLKSVSFSALLPSHIAHQHFLLRLLQKPRTDHIPIIISFSPNHSLCSISLAYILCYIYVCVYIYEGLCFGSYSHLYTATFKKISLTSFFICFLLVNY